MEAYGVKLGVACVSEAGALCVSIHPCWRKPDEATVMSASAAHISPGTGSNSLGTVNDCYASASSRLCNRILLTGLSCWALCLTCSWWALFTSIWLLPLLFSLSIMSWADVRVSLQIHFCCCVMWPHPAHSCRCVYAAKASHKLVDTNREAVCMMCLEFKPAKLTILAN